MPQERILIVEDDTHISKLIKYNLEKSGFDCTLAYDGQEALDLLQRSGFDLVILDIMLPKTDGLEVCRIIRQDRRLKNLPVVMLTAKGEEVDRVVGLELGADDYMVKPFSPRELVLRLKAILKRAKREPGEKETISAGELTVDIPRHTVCVGAKKIELTAMEFKLLSLLMRRAGRIQTRDVLLSDVWGLHSGVNTRTVDTHVKRLRQKLGKSGAMIKTVIGVGYKFQEDED